MNQVLKWVLIIVGLTVYLNTGWALGTYHYNNVSHKSVESRNIFDKFLAGPGYRAHPPGTAVEGHQVSLFRNQVTTSFIWPIVILMITSSWIIYFGYYLLWLIFAGGIAKLLGLG